MTHTNPQPCCAPSARHFGNPERPYGYELVQVTSPPWIATALGVLVTLGGYQLNKQDPDVGKALMAGGLAIPGAMWLKYSFPNED
jgi:hypothetical protein